MKKNMLQDTATIGDKYKLFVEKTAATKLVWGLKDKNGWANTHAADDEKVDVIPFWGDKADAKNCARDEWKDYLPAMIPLIEFLEGWCMEMAENNVLAGISWDPKMTGTEVGGTELALTVLEQLKITNADAKFLNHDSVDEFIAELNEGAE